jgi:hypothetical protein
MPYRYVPQVYAGVDPRAQTEDLGDDPVKASGYAVANLKRVVPNLVAWTTKPGGDYEELTEVYTETVGTWSQYMGHVAGLIGGVYVDFKTADQDGAVFRPVPKATQKSALSFLSEHLIRTPAWLVPEAVVSRIGPPPGNGSLATRQATAMNALLSVARLHRLAEAEALDRTRAYPVAEYLADLRLAVWGAPGATAQPDAGRRAMQRVYLDRLRALVEPPAPPAAGAAQGRGGGPPPTPRPFVTLPDVQRSDLPALARSQLRAIREQARSAAGTAPAGIARAHWQDVADRIDAILDPAGAR